MIYLVFWYLRIKKWTKRGQIFEAFCLCERRDIIDLNRRQKLTHPESRAIIKVEEAFMKGARHDKEWDDTNDT